MGLNLNGPDYTRYYEGNPSLRKRITLAVMIGMSIILLTFGIASHYIVQKSIEDSLNSKLAVGRIIRNNIDNIIKDNVNRLYDISISGSVDLNDKNLAPERDALITAYRYSIFTDGVFILDPGGNVIVNYPVRMRDTSLNLLSIEPVQRMLASGRPVVSNIYTLEPTKKKVLYILVPLKDKNGNLVGAAGGAIDPTNPILTHELQLVDRDRNRFIDIIDANGIVIASSNASRSLTQCDHNSYFKAIISSRKEHISTCHQCHFDRNEEVKTGELYARAMVEHVSENKSKKSTNTLVFVPLEMAPWGISIQEPKNDVFGPSAKLRKTFIGLGLVIIGIAFLLIIGISRSIVNPIKDLIQATNRLAKGEMSEPVTIQGNDEIGVLSQSFETMRMKLIESMDNIQKYNMELETRVKDRTTQIKESQERVLNLLKKIISTQEDERKRIARGLHDNSLQDLSAILMGIDMCKMHPEKITGRKIDEIRNIVLKTWDGVLAVIQNLRPSLLDDLGLEASIKWLLDIHLGEKGINYFFRIIGVPDKRFLPEIETTLFRIVQEAIVNIARHAKAENVFVILEIKEKTADVYIEDDGEGFNVHSLLQQTNNDTKEGRGLGLLGMKERASLIGGTLQICSSQDCGTRITMRFSLGILGDENV